MPDGALGSASASLAPALAPPGHGCREHGSGHAPDEESAAGSPTR